MEPRGRAVDPLTTIRTVAETGSTNTDMLALAAAGAGEGLWLGAERQTEGRGRQARRWVSEPGNLYASTLVRLRTDDPAAATLALVAGITVAEVVSAVMRQGSGEGAGGLSAKGLYLKWPNDLMLGGAKLSGILLERAGDAVVIGVGVNVRHHPELPDRPAISLAARGLTVEADELLAAIAERFADRLRDWRLKGLAPVRDRWLALAHPTGCSLTARLPDGTALDGVFDGLAADGALLLRLADGTTRVIHAGDVFTL